MKLDEDVKKVLEDNGMHPMVDVLTHEDDLTTENEALIDEMNNLEDDMEEIALELGLGSYYNVVLIVDRIRELVELEKKANESLKRT